MTVRPFDWRDLAHLHRLRNQSVFLDSALVLTRGPLLVPGALLSFLAPGMGVFTAVSQGENKHAANIVGQIIHLLGSPFAHLTFVTPDDSLDSPALPLLIEYLISVSGQRGAFRLLADVDEHKIIYEVLRRSSFAIYSRQRIWQLTRRIPAPRETEGSQRYWKIATRRDALAIQVLYNNLVPGLVQQIEPFVIDQRPRGMVYRQGDDLTGYVELRYGQRGIWAHPFVHPDAQEVSESFADLLHSLTSRGNRPVYICVRSYQSWLEPFLEDLGAEAGPRQAVMVKHLASLQTQPARAWNAAGAMPALESGQPEVTASITNSTHGE
jgi:hypothetical protein